MAEILIVDDSPTVLKSMDYLLVRLGHTVIAAASAEEAIAEAGNPGIKLVITDYHMPRQNGVDLIRALKAGERHRFTPMLLLTAESQQAKRDEARAAGSAGWLVKPVDPKQLEVAVGRLIKE